MSKIIIIDDCCDCPNVLFGCPNTCQLKNNRRISDNHFASNIIPSWCPLKDVQELDSK